MEKRRVLVIGSNHLFLDSINRLLQHPDIALIGFIPDSVDLTEMINQLHPEIVIWEGEPESIETKALHILEKAQHKKLRIINLNSQNNAVNLYAADLGTLNSKEELLQLILKE